jgi:hypothetical protein
MKIRNTVGTLALAAGLLGTATVGIAAPVEIEIRTAPPADRVEVVPAPRPGFVFEKGHYQYDGEKYVWQEGQFFKEREGQKYIPYAFEKRGDLYYYRPGYWEKIS